MRINRDQRVEVIVSLPFASGRRRALFPEWFAFVYAVLAAALVVVGLEPVPTMAVPVVLTILPLVFSGRAVRLGAALFLGVFVALGAMSVGALFVPAVIALAIAADRARDPAPATGRAPGHRPLRS